MPRPTRLPALLLVLLVPSAGVAGQAPDAKAEVQAVINRLWEGMQKGDSAMVRSVFHPQARMSTAFVRQGTPSIEIESIEGFIKAVGTPHDKLWDERTRNVQIQIDGTLASAWMDYSFYLGGQFSHCGVDAFQLARDTGGWKVVALADTRRREGCPDQPS
jgi:putative lumazine-binding protein